MLGAGAAFSTVLTAFRYTNGIRGDDPTILDEEEVERRENAKKLRRRPLSETIEQLGEGRGKGCCKQWRSILMQSGIYAPGYEERRRQRLLEKYGIDVKAAQEST
jgi:hypothetical protein